MDSKVVNVFPLESLKEAYSHEIDSDKCFFRFPNIGIFVADSKDIIFIINLHTIAFLNVLTTDLSWEHYLKFFSLDLSSFISENMVLIMSEDKKISFMII